MNEVDQIILQSLRQLNCHFFVEDAERETISSLDQLPSDYVIEAVVRALWKFDPSFKNEFPSCRAPPASNSIKRFRVANKLVGCLKNNGVETQFQSLLYPGQYETRRLLLALFEKLPKVSIKIDPTSLSPLEQLKASIGKVLFEHLRRSWERRLKFDEEDDSSKPIGRTLTRKELHLSDYNLAELRARFAQLAAVEPVAIIKFSSSASMLPPPKPPKPVLLPKPKKYNMIKDALEKPNTSGESSTTMDTAQGQEIREKSEEFIEKQHLLDHISEKAQSFQRLMGQLNQAHIEAVFNESELARLNSRLESDDAERMLELLVDPDESIHKLQKIVADADDRRTALEERFTQAKASKHAELESLRPDGTVLHYAEVRLRDRLQILTQKGEELGTKIVTKQQIFLKLQKELAKQQAQYEHEHAEDKIAGSRRRPANPRKKYARRILEICANVNRQNDEIRKTVASINGLNHELEQLGGVLDRTWTAVERWLSRLANQDSRMHQAYRLLQRSHAQCAAVRASVDETGQLARDIDELTDKIDLEAQRCESVDGQIEKIFDDLFRVRRENSQLSQQIEDEIQRQQQTPTK